MNKCEHGEKVIKFCVTEHCHHKEAAGCDYCMKRYHFHLTNTVQLSENNIEDIIRKLNLPTDSKYKTRGLQENAIDYLRNIKNSMNHWFDQAQNAVADRLSHPLLRKEGLLPIYNRLKYKEYRKINAKELKAINEFAKNKSSEELKHEEISRYYQEVEWTKQILNAAERLVAELVKLPEIKEGEGTITAPSKTKTKDILESIGREMDRRHSQEKSVPAPLNSAKLTGIKFEESTLMKRREGVERKTSENQTENSEELPTRKRSTQPEPYIVTDALENLGEISPDKGEKRLKRRRSSIDDKIDLKFGSAIEEKTKESEERKKRLIDTLNDKKSL